MTEKKREKKVHFQLTKKHKDNKEKKEKKQNKNLSISKSNQSYHHIFLYQ